jgi:hypothetical protein
MVALSPDYQPIEIPRPIFTLKGLEDEMSKFLHAFGNDQEVLHLKSYRRFAE